MGVRKINEAMNGAAEGHGVCGGEVVGIVQITI